MPGKKIRTYTVTAFNFSTGRGLTVRIRASSPQLAAKHFRKDHAQYAAITAIFEGEYYSLL